MSRSHSAIEASMVCTWDKATFRPRRRASCSGTTR
ncbi:UNVERIFIED_CONTAM: hypothetical protein GTU68_038390 [Idotea baltica]|nr:hypothetical protein [Idotea baltica]